MHFGINTYNTDIKKRHDGYIILRENPKNHTRPIEEKESIRWIDTALTAKKYLTNADVITVIGDRESDIFEMYNRVPDQHTHIIVRASHDRVLSDKETCPVTS